MIQTRRAGNINFRLVAQHLADIVVRLRIMKPHCRQGLFGGSSRLNTKFEVLAANLESLSRQGLYAFKHHT